MWQVIPRAAEKHRQAQEGCEKGCYMCTRAPPRGHLKNSVEHLCRGAGGGVAPQPGPTNHTQAPVSLGLHICPHHLSEMPQRQARRPSTQRCYVHERPALSSLSTPWFTPTPATFRMNRFPSEMLIHRQLTSFPSEVTIPKRKKNNHVCKVCGEVGPCGCFLSNTSTLPWNSHLELRKGDKPHNLGQKDGTLPGILSPSKEYSLTRKPGRKGLVAPPGW